jgi:hypothetical protein
MYVERNIGKRSRNRCCRGKKSSKYNECPAVCVTALFIRLANRFFSAPYCIVFCGLTGCTVFFWPRFLTNGPIFGGK